MHSSLTWLDYSERDRRRAMDVIDLFRETGTLDELGLAGVGNSFSDLLFPGTSTIQTRACYFLLVPWMFQELERLKVPSSRIQGRARSEELALIPRLLEGSDTDGVIGRVARHALKRLPSEIYWGGLGSWGIRTFSRHKWAYFRSLDSFHRRVARFSAAQDPEGGNAPPTNWHPHLPDPPPGFPKANVSVALRPEDGRYLRERIQASHPESLLALLVGRANAKDLGVERPWELAGLTGLTPTLQEDLHDARLFALCAQGAALVYNLRLAELRKNENWIEKHRTSLHRWAVGIDSLDSDLKGWSPDRVWRTVRAQGRPVGYPTRDFVERWLDVMRRVGSRAIAEDRSARDLVRDREIQVKRGRARFANPRRLELWGGSSGTGLMSYRWGSARGLLRDIFDGLAQDKGDVGNA